MDSINWLAIAASVVACFVIGAIWYSPPVFGRHWMAGIGKTEEDLKGGATFAYLVALLSSFLTAVVMAYVVRWATSTTVLDGMMAGITVWAGFSLTTLLLTGVFEQRAWSVIMINAGNLLLNFMAVGAILGGWG